MWEMAWDGRGKKREVPSDGLVGRGREKEVSQKSLNGFFSIRH